MQDSNGAWEVGCGDICNIAVIGQDSPWPVNTYMYVLPVPCGGDPYHEIKPPAHLLVTDAIPLSSLHPGASARISFSRTLAMATFTRVEPALMEIA